MKSIILITLKGIFRDRIFQGIMAVAVLFLAIPSAASLSMRQVAELSATLSLSLISFILLLLSVFLGATSLWKDIERRYTFSVLSLPVSRSSYIVGKFIGISIFMLIVSAILAVAAIAAVYISSSMYKPDREILAGYLLLSIGFTALKYILLVAAAILLSSFSTSFFLPVFGTISIYLASGVTQQVYEYVTSPAAEKIVTPFTRSAASALYYILPNLSGFDLKVNAIYSIKPDYSGLFLSLIYFSAYSAILIGAASFIFSKREMK